MNRKSALMIICIAVSISVLTGCKKSSDGELEIPIYDASSANFDTAVVSREDIEDVFLTKGSIGYLNVSAVTFSGKDGVVEAVNCEEGNSVKQGDTLVVIGNTSLTSEYNSQKNQVEFARLKVESLKQNGADSYSIRSAEADYEIEKVKLEEKSAELEQYTIKSPFDGVIRSLCETEKGKSVSKDDVILTIAESASLCAYFSGDGTNNFSYGQSVSITCANNSAQASVVSVPSDAPAGSSSAASKAVVFSLPNIDLTSWVDINKTAANISSLRDENLTSPTLISTADIKLIKDSRHNVLTIPIKAVSYKNEKPYVYVYKDGTKLQTFVELGLITFDKAEVTDGLEEGETVILNTAQKTSSSEAVTDQSTKSTKPSKK